MLKSPASFAALAGSILLANPASACVPDPRAWQQEGESVAAYEARVQKMERERSERRQQGALNAPTLFIVRAATGEFFEQEAAKWRAAEQMRSAQSGEPPIPPPPPAFPAPAYFRPIAWLRGAGSPDLISIETRQTTCGYMAMGDTLFAKDGVEYVFAAREGPISEKTLLDAIAIDKITAPELVELIARHREHPGAGSESPGPSRP